MRSVGGCGLMAPQELQALVDAQETDSTQRYLRRQWFSAVITDAVRRADALSRLEIELVRRR